MSFLTVPLSTKHDRLKFSCGVDLLDSYFKKQAKQDIKRKLSACFVLEGQNKTEVCGYYTLSSSGIPNELIPEEFKKKLPQSYSSIPTILIGRLAVDAKMKGKGLGKMLLIDALKRSFAVSNSIGAYAVVVDPIDVSAESFYANYGFLKLETSKKMFLPMKTIQQLFA